MPIAQFIDLVSRGFSQICPFFQWMIFMCGIVGSIIVLITYIPYCLDNPWKVKTYLMFLVFAAASLLSLYLGVWAGVAGGYIK